jgi:hypothetical protein
MCDCTSCTATQNAELSPTYRYMDYDEDGEIKSKPLPPKDPLPFSAWPKGQTPPSSVYGRKKIPADPAYTAHWRISGGGLAYAPVEQKKVRARPDLHQFIPAIGGHDLGACSSGQMHDIWKQSPRPATIRLTHTQLNRNGWRERMVALNAASIGRGDE